MSIQLIQSPNLKSLLRENIKSERENFAFEQLSSIFLKSVGLVMKNVYSNLCFCDTSGSF